MNAADTAVPPALKSRKSPRQRRSVATVELIQEATIQVLLSDGLARLTTTRVAERAGVSVGSLYQYFPNKQALLFALLLSHFDEMAAAMEGVAAQLPDRTLDRLADGIADAYVDVKMAKPEATTALYRVAAAIDQVRLSADAVQRLEAATVALLQGASDARFADPRRTAFTLLGALAGVTRGSFGNPATRDEALAHLPVEARRLARAYLRAAAAGDDD